MGISTNLVSDIDLRKLQDYIEENKDRIVQEVKEESEEFEEVFLKNTDVSPEKLKQPFVL